MTARDSFPRVKNGLPPIHPGEMLADELVAMGLSADELNMLLSLPEGTVSKILAGRRGIDADFALRIARYLGGGERLWMNLQVSFDLKIAQRKSGAAIAQQITPRKDNPPTPQGESQ